MNEQLIEQLDDVLDSVDEIIQKLDLPTDVKRGLTSHVYKLYSDAEDAVMETV